MAEEAKAYSDELKAELANMSGAGRSGNPVTDVILQEFKKESERSGISFCTEFYFPTDSGINVFDVSIILNNALQNALENTQGGKEICRRHRHRMERGGVLPLCYVDGGIT